MTDNTKYRRGVGVMLLNRDKLTAPANALAALACEPGKAINARRKCPQWVENGHTPVNW